MLVSKLSKSASYIAVPPAMRLGIPEANPSLHLIHSLGITFAFKMIVRILLYDKMSCWAIGMT